MKKDLAILITINDAYSFAAANVIQSLRQHNPNLQFDVVIYHDGIQEHNKKALNAINGKAIIFKDYSLEYFLKKCPNVPKDAPFLKKWSFLVYARMELFELLNEYKKVLYLDADLHFRGEIDYIVKQNGIAWRDSAADFHGFAKGYMKIPEEYTMPNGGLIFVTDSILEISKKFTDVSYQIINDAYGKTRKDRGQDEIVFGILNYKYNLNVVKLPMIYNCPLGGKQTNKAIVLHFMGDIAKIWNNVILANFFYDFKINYQNFLDNGGTSNIGSDSFLTADNRYDKSFGLLQAYTHVRLTVLWSRLFNSYELAHKLHSDIIMPSVYTKPYILFYIKNLPREIHYEMTFSDDYRKVFVCFHVEKELLLIEKQEEELNNLAKCLSFNFTKINNRIKFEKETKLSETIDIFTLFVNMTINSFKSLFYK